MKALEFEDGNVRAYKGGFAMYGAEYHNGLARELDCEVNEDGSIEVDDHDGHPSLRSLVADGYDVITF